MNTKSDGKLPSDFLHAYHVHVLCLRGELRFSDGKTEHCAKQNHLVIWQMSNTILNVEYSADFEADFLLASPNFLKHYNPEMAWATKGFVFIKQNPSFRLTEQSVQLIRHDFEEFRYRQQQATALFRDDVLGRVMQIFLFDLWQVYSQAMEELTTDDNSSKIFLRFIDLVMQHCKTHRDVAFYADLLCITPKYLSQVSNIVTQLPASQWISYYTSFELVKMLDDTSMSITDICYAMDFSATSFFSRYVKGVLGVTPSEYRKRKNNAANTPLGNVR